MLKDSQNGTVKKMHIRGRRFEASQKVKQVLDYPHYGIFSFHFPQMLQYPLQEFG